MPPHGDDRPVSHIGARPAQELELEAPGREAKQPEFMEVFKQEQEQPHPHGAGIDFYDDFPSPPATIESFNLPYVLLQLDRCGDTLSPLAGDGTGPCKDAEMEVSTTITEPEYIPPPSPQTGLAPPSPAAGEGAGATSGREETELAGFQTPTTVLPLRPCTDAEMEVDYSSLVDALTSPAPVPSSVAGAGPSSLTSSLDELSPTATDEEMMRLLKQHYSSWSQKTLGIFILESLFHLSRFYLDPASAKTPGGGYWREAKEPGAITAIRTGLSDSNCTGLRRTLEFVPEGEGDCKDKWLAHEYILLEHLQDDKGGRRRAQIVEEVTIRKLFKHEPRSLNLKRPRKTQDDSAPVISSEPSDMWNLHDGDIPQIFFHRAAARLQQQEEG